MTESRKVHIIVHGLVQGVSFRAWTQHQAQLHGLSGWVRNRRDGTVEALFSGPGNLVEIVLKACQVGPAGSRVEKVEIIDGDRPEDTIPDRFEIRSTI